MNVELTYFTNSGKYYTGGNYNTAPLEMWEIFQEVQEKLEKEKLPGLADRDDELYHHFYVYVNTPLHPSNYPGLCIPFAWL